jgi:tRNA(Ile)-lysidine synthetase-like protein
MNEMNEINKKLELWESVPELWFNSSLETDKKVQELFGPLKPLIDITVTFWKDLKNSIRLSKVHSENDESKQSTKSKQNGEINHDFINNALFCIIFHDQIIKHYYRDNETVIKHSNHIALMTSDLVQLSKNCYENDKLNDYEFIHQVSPVLFTFYLMPQRHSKDPARILNTILEIFDHPLWKDGNSQLVRFYKATITQLVSLNCTKFTNNFNLCNKSNYEWDEFSSILEYFPDSSTNLQTDNSEYKKLHSNSDNCFETHFDYFFNKYLHDYKNSKIIVSLSGGVDSNVLLYLLTLWKTKNKLHNLSLEAVHINYNNRKTCELEIKFIKQLCKWLNVKLTVKFINEINRNDIKHIGILRGFYENISRKIRFQTYSSISNKSHCVELGINNSIVLLGHHSDDSLENIYSNLMTGKNIKNLLGMEEYYQEQLYNVHPQNNVNIGRPFLKFNKEIIIQFAKQFGIPYLVDSTSDVCNRGKLRDQLIPFMDSFDSRLNINLVQHSKTVSRMYDTIEKFVWKPYLDSIQWGNNLVTVDFNPEIHEWGMEFWQPFFVKVARYFNTFYPRKRSVQNVLNVFKTQTEFKRIELTKRIKLIKKDKIKILFT